MEVNLDHLPNDIEALKALFIKTVAQKNSEIVHLEEIVRLLRRQRFAAKSEIFSVGQRSLFDEAEILAPQACADETAEEADTSSRKSKKKRPVRKPLPEYLPRIDRVIDLPDEEKICPTTGAPLRRIGEEVSEQLDIIPARVQVIRTIRPKYACSCSECTPKLAALPLHPIPKSMASPGLLAFVATSKYADALPLYRQEGILGRIGCSIPRTTLANWMIRCGTLVQPIVNLMRDHLLEAPLIYCDETPVQVLKNTGRKAASKSYMWVQARWGPQGQRIVIYDFDQSRSGTVPVRLLADYQGYLHTDGYQGYNEIGKGQGIKHVACWAHVRRKFDEAWKAPKDKSKVTKAGEALKLIQKLYKIEAESESLSAAEHLKIRQTQSKEVVVAIRQWLDNAQIQVPPKSLIGQALTYLEGQWEKLIIFLDDPIVGLDTNVVENAIRPFAVGRKNWLFSDSLNGANASASIYSLVVTARANGIDPYSYLRYIFEMLPLAKTVDDFEALLPTRQLPET